ncbi:MAG: T9SS type A sorting domain-containing protein [Paludibacteraceae bacterium]|nr:T9SS type A sorting domain-containing protein [Paludibacteraceae bacterium]
MKKIFATLSALALSATALLAQVTQTEYFFDEDPGFGKGIKAGVATGSTIKFKANIRGLKNGFHTLYVRGRNYEGWGHCVAIPVTVYERSADIVGSEYYFDKDPGEGKGKFLENTADGAAINVISSDVLNKVDYGFHTLYSRALSNDNSWTNPFGVPFVYLSLVSPVTRSEFYVDKDPGEGNGKVATIENGAVYFQMKTDNLKSGKHTLYVRSQDASGYWTVEYAIPFNYNINSEVVTWNDFVSVSPNPTMFNFDLSINSADETSNTSVAILSQSGKVLFDKQYPASEKKINFNVKEFAPGSYQVVVDRGGIIAIRKLVIKR